MNGRAVYWNPYAAGTALGIVLAAAFVLTGHGLGASGGIGRAIVGAEAALAPAHARDNAHHALAAADPISRNWAFWMVLGVAAGGLASGLLARRVRAETFRGPRISARARWVLAAAGGAAVGYGAAMARGCTSGQALSGGAVLSLGSWVFMFSVFGGGYLLAWFVRRLWT